MNIPEFRGIPVDKVRLIVIVIVCFCMVLSCILVVEETLSTQVHEGTFRAIFMTYMSYYSPIIMLLVGHYVATNNSAKAAFLSVHYLVLLGVIGTIYVVTPILCLKLSPSYQSAITYTEEIGGVFSLPLFLLLGLIFTSNDQSK